MNKNALFLILLNWLLLGCAAPMASDPPGPPGPPGPPPDPPGAVTCTAYEMKVCKGDKTDPHVTINLDEKTVDPECIKAKKGRVIIFKLESNSPIQKGSVEIIAKDSSDDWWLSGSNSPNKKRILVLAPKKKEDNSYLSTGIRHYKVKTDTWCIDPRVNVKN